MARHVEETADLISRMGGAKDGALRSLGEGGPITREPAFDETTSLSRERTRCGGLGRSPECSESIPPSDRTT